MQERYLVFGNSGAGKSTLAKRLAAKHGLAHLDLDTLAWEHTPTPTRRNLVHSARDLQRFTDANDGWVVEGCYTDLLELLAAQATQAIWLNVPVETCVANARARPWEPHKYPSKEAQDANLDMLVAWIRDYDTRADTFSRTAHKGFFERFPGSRQELTDNSQSAAMDAA